MKTRGREVALMGAARNFILSKPEPGEKTLS